MLMPNGPPNGRGDDAYAQLAREYRNVALIIDACFAAYAAISHAVRRRRTRRMLETLDAGRLDDIGFTPSDLHNGRLDDVLHRQAGIARPWTAARTWLLTSSRCRTTLAALGDDHLCDLSEQGLAARREARHDHSGGRIAPQTSGGHR